MTMASRQGHGLPPLGDFSRSVRARALALLKSGAVEPDPEFPDLWWVPSSSGMTRYRVQLNRNWGWLTCTCPHGLNSGGGDCRCYHVAAVLLLLKAEEAPTGPGGTPHPDPRQHRCPACQSAPGRRCTAPTDNGRRAVDWVHHARQDLADGIGSP